MAWLAYPNHVIHFGVVFVVAFRFAFNSASTAFVRPYNSPFPYLLNEIAACSMLNQISLLLPLPGRSALFFVVQAKRSARTAYRLDAVDTQAQFSMLSGIFWVFLHFCGSAPASGGPSFRISHSPWLEYSGSLTQLLCRLRGYFVRA